MKGELVRDHGYKKWVSRPLYKLSRKLDLPQWSSLAIANAPWSLAVALPSYSHPLLATGIFVGLDALLTLNASFKHKVTLEKRNQKNERARLEKIHQLEYYFNDETLERAYSEPVDHIVPTVSQEEIMRRVMKGRTSMTITERVNYERLASSDPDERIYGISHLIALGDNKKVFQAPTPIEATKTAMDTIGLTGNPRHSWKSIPDWLEEDVMETVTTLRAYSNSRQGPIPTGTSMENYLDNHFERIFKDPIDGPEIVA